MVSNALSCAVLSGVVTIAIQPVSRTQTPWKVTGVDLLSPHHQISIGNKYTIARIMDRG